MPEHRKTGYDQKSADKKKSADADEKADIIELSDIAVGTSQEDDAIIELTEELIGEAMDGISRATYEDFSEEEHLIDLSHDHRDRDVALDAPLPHGKEDANPVDDAFSETKEPEGADDTTQNLEKELDDFFGDDRQPSQEPSPEPDVRPGNDASPAVSATTEKELLSALEVMIRNKYGDRIHHMLVAAIDKIVAEEFERIKKHITDSIKS